MIPSLTSECQTDQLPRSRKEAIAVGAKFYCTGVPCVTRGHTSKRRTSDGHCLKCAAIRAKPYMAIYRPAYYARNKDKFAVYHQRWVSKGNNRERRRQRSTEYRTKNREKHLESLRRWRDANRERFRKICREWARANRDKRRAQRGMRRNAPGTFTAADIATIFRGQKGRCALPTCRKKLGNDFHVDHIVALVNGGSNWSRNLQLLCPKCNASKGARDPIDHARSLGFLL